MNDPYKYFMIEADELIEKINRDILEFEKKTEDPDLLKSLFRYAHTLKGAAHVVGLLNISKLAHLIEEIFTRTRDYNLQITKEMVTLILETLDLIKDIIGIVKEGQPENLIDITETLERFKLVDKVKSPLVDIKKTEQSLGFASQFGKETQPVIHTKKQETARISLLDIDDLMNQASELVIGAIRMERLYTSFRDTAVSFGRLAEVYRKAKRKFETTPEILSINKKSSDFFSNLPRQIDMESLYLSLFENTAILDSNVEELKQISDSIYQIIYRVRSIKVSDMSHYFKTAVRDLSVKLNKQLDIAITGDDVELDRNLLEELKEPINQIIRNAAVHGIEDETSRLAKGKNIKGLIKLNFEKAGDFVHIICEDDGCGISVEKIKEIAISKGLIDEKRGAEIENEEALYLIFASGISSGKIITEFAGRGVGLDIVKNKVDSLRGEITIDTLEDKFTRFSIKLPLALNMINAFLVEVSGEQFLIPLNMVIKTGYLSPGEIESVAGKHVINLDGSPVSIARLSEILNLGGGDSLQKKPFILLKSGRETAAYSVDCLMGVHRIIIKDLGGGLKNAPFILGGAILSSGNPALVLNIAALFRQTAESSIFNGQNISEGKASSQDPHILAVDDSLTSRVLLSGILEAEGYHVTCASSGEEALEFIAGDKYDLIISDVEMPGIDGFQLSERIRADIEHKDTPIIIVSALAKDEHRRKGIQVGAQAYIVKGEFDQGLFLETVKRLAG